MSVLDYVEIGSYIYQIKGEDKEEKWIIKDIKKKDLLIQSKETGKNYKMTEKELESLYRKRLVRISRKGE
jgi:hypothetical protein